MRLGKAGEPSFHTDVPQIASWKWLPVQCGTDSDKTILTTGKTLETGMAWINQNPNFTGFSLCTMPLWGMAAKRNQKTEVAPWTQVVMIEDHLLDGGFGSWLLESLVTTHELLVRIQPHALNSRVCRMAGSQSALMQNALR